MTSHPTPSVLFDAAVTPHFFKHIKAGTINEAIYKPKEHTVGTTTKYCSLLALYMFGP